MGATKAQKTKTGRKNYGKNYGRGRAGERKAAAALRQAGYSVSISRGSAGFADVTAKKNGRTRRIQVKTLSSRRILTKEAAKKRIEGKPFNVRSRPAGGEIWVYDADGRRHVLRGRS